MERRKGENRINMNLYFSKTVSEGKSELGQNMELQGELAQVQGYFHPRNLHGFEGEVKLLEEKGNLCLQEGEGAGPRGGKWRKGKPGN